MSLKKNITHCPVCTNNQSKLEYNIGGILCEHFVMLRHTQTRAHIHAEYLRVCTLFDVSCTVFAYTMRDHSAVLYVSHNIF